MLKKRFGKKQKPNFKDKKKKIITQIIPIPTIPIPTIPIPTFSNVLYPVVEVKKEDEEVKKEDEETKKLTVIVKNKYPYYLYNAKKNDFSQSSVRLVCGSIMYLFF